MLVCGWCGLEVDANEASWRCSCGGPWSFASTPDPPAALDRLRIGEGNTPLIDVRLGGQPVKAKLEFASPTLSFKDRGAVYVVAAAVDAGVKRIVVDSSGNAGAAIAAYAARAGLLCTVFVPATASAAKVESISVFGATVERVPGTREDTAAAAIEYLDTHDAAYASHVWNPWFSEGTKGYVHELWAQSGRRLPDTLVLPAGNGTLVVGARRAIAELLAKGDIEAAPRIVAVQAAGCAPVAIAFTAGLDQVAPVTNRGTVADGIAIAAPVRGPEILAAVRETNGLVVTVTDDEILSAQRELAAQGLSVEPTGAVAAAAAVQLDGERVVPLSGAGRGHTSSSHTGA